MLGDACAAHIAHSCIGGTILIMSNVSTKTRHGSAAEFVLDRDARMEARKRVVGLWRGKVKVMIADARKLRREWDKRLSKLQ